METILSEFEAILIGIFHLSLFVLFIVAMIFIYSLLKRLVNYLGLGEVVILDFSWLSFKKETTTTKTTTTTTNGTATKNIDTKP